MKHCCPTDYYCDPTNGQCTDSSLTPPTHRAGELSPAENPRPEPATPERQLHVLMENQSVLMATRVVWS